MAKKIPQPNRTATITMTEEQWLEVLTAIDDRMKFAREYEGEGAVGQSWNQVLRGVRRTITDELTLQMGAEHG